MALTNKQIGTARRLGTEQARKDADLGRRQLAGSVDKPALYAKVLDGAYDEAVGTRLHEAYSASYITKWQLIQQCDHAFPQGKTDRDWGTSDGARCINCNLLVTAGSTLPIDDLVDEPTDA